MRLQGLVVMAVGSDVAVPQDQLDARPDLSQPQPVVHQVLFASLVWARFGSRRWWIDQSKLCKALQVRLKEHPPCCRKP